MPEQAKHIPYKQVTKALNLPWAWFKLEPKGIDGGAPIMISPVSVGERVYDSERRQLSYTFKAEDERGAIYEITVYSEGINPTKVDRASWESHVSAYAEYTVSPPPVPLSRVRTR